MADVFVNLWGSLWVRGSHVVSVTTSLDPDWDGDSGELVPTVWVRMRDGVVHSNTFPDSSMDVDAFVKELVRRLAGEDVD